MAISFLLSTNPKSQEDRFIPKRCSEHLDVQKYLLNNDTCLGGKTNIRQGVCISEIELNIPIPDKKYRFWGLKTLDAPDYSMDFSHSCISWGDGNMLACLGNEIYLYEVETSTSGLIFSFGYDVIITVIKSPAKGVIVVGLSTNEITIILETLEGFIKAFNISKSVSEITDLAFHKNKLAVNSGNEVLLLTFSDEYTSFKKSQLSPQNGKISGIDWSPEGKYMLTLHENGVISIFGINSAFALTVKLPDDYPDRFLKAKFIPWRKRQLVSGGSELIAIWTIEGVSLKQTKIEDPIVEINFHKENKAIITGHGGTNSIIVWDMNLVKHFEIETSKEILTMSVSPSYKYLSVAFLDETIMLYEMHSVEKKKEEKEIYPFGMTVR
jgi:WD40 repeat protein